MSLISVYARKERTTDPLLAGPENNDRMDIVIYRTRNVQKFLSGTPGISLTNPVATHVRSH